MLFYAYSFLLCNLNTLWNIIMILHSYVEKVLTICCVQEWQLLLSYFLSYFPLMVSDAISFPLHNVNTLWYIIMILYNYVEQVLTIRRILECHFPLIVSDAILCPLHNLKTLWFIIMILYSYVEHILMMCQVQEW